MEPDTSQGDICGNKSKGNEQSREAFEKSKAGLNRLEKRIYEYLLALGGHGATSEELAYKMNVRYTSVSGRISQLKADGLVEVRRDDAGKPMLRQNITGRSAAVVVAVKG